MNHLERAQSIYMVGIAGMGMAPLAVYLKSLGHSVCGWDDALTAPTIRWLSFYRITITPEIPLDVQTLVYSSAIGPYHPLRVEAERRGTQTFRRGECLAQVAQGKRLVAVVGSHGKTTTAGMLAHILKASGAAVDYVMGGLLRDPIFPPALVQSGSQWLLAEVDESDGTIDLFSPEITVALNVDWDHPGYYKSTDQVSATFRGLFKRTRAAVVLPQGDAQLLELTRESGAKIIQAARYEGSVGGCLGEFNAINAGTALEAVRAVQLSLAPAPLADFSGIARRQDVLYRSEKLTALADYAHHPAELEALLKAVRADLGPHRQIVAVFQPHRYTRTKLYSGDFASVLAKADITCLLPVYAASEPEDLAGSSQAILKHNPSLIDWTRGAAPDYFEQLESLCEGTSSVLLFIGAGDIEQLSSDWKMRKTAQAADHFSIEALKPLLSAGTIFKENEPLGPRTTLRVGGSARWYAEPACDSDLSVLVKAANRAGIKLFILGRGSNLIIPSRGFDGLVVCFKHPYWQRAQRLSELELLVGSGMRLKELCGQASKLGLSGFEFLEGIPGTVGGALRMNAGAMGPWMFNVTAQLEWMDRAGTVRITPASELSVSYRRCDELVSGIALRAVLRAVKTAAPQEIDRAMLEYATKRKASQPRQPSAGCMFKNPQGDYAGRLIEACGLKGFTLGGAQVSDVHANFMINANAASAEDALNLMNHVRRIVLEKTAVALEAEVLVLGE